MSGILHGFLAVSLVSVGEIAAVFKKTCPAICPLFPQSATASFRLLWLQGWRPENKKLRVLTVINP